MKRKTSAILTMLMLPLAVLVLLWATRPLPVRAATITVCPLGGGCDYDTIEAAVNAANAGDVIAVQVGTYNENIVIDNINGVLTIQGAGPGSTIVSGENGVIQSVFEVSGNVELTMSGMTIRNGETTLLNSDTFGLGGGIYVDTAAKLHLSEVRVTSNSAELAGGGIANLGELTIENSDITDNVVTESAGEGGGLYSAGPATMTQTLVSGNDADVGGGITVFETTTITDATIEQNTAVDGGGIYADSADVYIEQTTVRLNTVTEQGGGLFAVESDVVVADSIFTGNEAHGGGGIYHDLSFTRGNAVSILRSTFSSNTATGPFSSDGGGGIYNNHVMTLTQSLLVSNNTTQNNVFGGGLHNAANGRFVVENSTLSSNQANSGGGIFNSGQMTLTNVTLYRNLGIDPGVSVYMTPTLAIPPAMTITPTLVAMNTAVLDGLGAANCGGATGWTSAGYNAASDGSCGLTTAGDLQNVSGFLQPLADNGGSTQTHAPLPNSPLIDAGNPNNAACPAVDQRGVSRPVGVRCDIGAFETTALDVFLPVILR